MFGSIGSPNFGPVGCVGACLLFLFMVSVVGGLLLMAAWPFLFPYPHVVCMSPTRDLPVCIVSYLR